MPESAAVVSSGQEAAREPRDWSLDLLRIGAILGVVSIHTFGALMTNPAMRGTADRWVAVALDAGMIWAVPVFVMMSGTLLLSPRAHADGPARFYRRRLVRLLPAFVVWQVFYLLVVRQLISGLHETPGDVLKLLLSGTTYTHLYFLWLILGLYAVAPVLRAFLAQGGRARAMWFAGIVLSASVLTSISSSLLGFAGDPRPLTLLALTQWIPYVGYFLAGWALKDVLLTGFARWGVTAIAVLSVAEIVLQSGKGWTGPLFAFLPLSYYGPVPALAAVSIFLAVRSWCGRVELPAAAERVLRELSEATFGVYLVHFVVLILLRMLPPFATYATSAPVSLLLFAATAALSFAVVAVLRRIPVLRRIV
ncbi:acyltransferase family protein [Microbacterium sp.]|uniref:acyltransferase n=1 Tax=Microbacterium sp. TaxID=51671 RepID=UPI0033423B10